MRINSADRYLVGPHLHLAINMYGQDAEHEAQKFADMLKERARGAAPYWHLQPRPPREFLIGREDRWGANIVVVEVPKVFKDIKKK